MSKQNNQSGKITANKSILGAEERLKKIIDDSYEILCNKIAAGGIEVPNEASLQMQFGVILKQVGQLYEFNPSDHFHIELEKPIVIPAVPESQKVKVRCDVYVAIETVGQKKVEAYIELKCMKKHKNETVTDNRYAIVLDLQKLECYKNRLPESICYSVVYTDNLNYTKSNSQTRTKKGIDLCSGTVLHGAYSRPNEMNAKLCRHHTIFWDCYESPNNSRKPHCFMKLGF